MRGAAGGGRGAGRAPLVRAASQVILSRALHDVRRAVNAGRNRRARRVLVTAHPMPSLSTTPAPRAQLEDLGRTPNYRVVRGLGEGSHGVVLLVRHARLEKLFVMKLIQQKFLADPAIVARFIAEAQRGAKLSHEAFAPIVDLGETEDGRTFFVMEYVEGSTLLDVLRTKGALPIEEAIVLGLQLLDGLVAAHDGHLIHRDIKPANLFITARGRLKILDLGISKSILESGTGPNTAKGVAIGTPRYMSPEQAYGTAVSFATDIYAVGLVLFEMLAGLPVFDATATHALIRCHVKEPPPSMQKRCGRAFPAELEAIVARALSKQQSDRFQTAREMQRALHRVLDSLHMAPARAPVRTSAMIAAREVEALFAGVATTVESPAPTEIMISPALATASDSAEVMTRTHDDAPFERARPLPKASRFGPLLVIAAACFGLGLIVAIATTVMYVVGDGGRPRASMTKANLEAAPSLHLSRVTPSPSPTVEVSSSASVALPAPAISPSSVAPTVTTTTKPHNASLAQPTTAATQQVVAPPAASIVEKPEKPALAADATPTGPQTSTWGAIDDRE
jgi:eukaryotic-like serine/threonine-protein kinase